MGQLEQHQQNKALETLLGALETDKTSLVETQEVERSVFHASSEGFRERGSWSENLLFPTGHADAHTQNEEVATVLPGTSQMTGVLHTCDTCSSKHCHRNKDTLWHLMGHRIFLCCSCRYIDNRGIGNDKHSAAERKEEVMVLCNQ